MNIGFDAKRALFNRSGLGNYSRSTLRLLAHYYPDNQYTLFSSKVNTSLFQPAINQNIVSPDDIFFAAFPALWRSWGINRQMRINKIQIFHGLSNELPYHVHKTGARTVVTIHDLIFLRYPEYYPSPDRHIYTLKFRHACKAADTIIATSQATKTDIVNHFGTDPKKIAVVYQTCDPVFRLSAPAEKTAEVKKKYGLPDKFILYLGTIEKRKNALSLIKAYFDQQIDMPLVIAGRPTKYMAEINHYLATQQNTSRILFRHAVETADLPALYQLASLFVYPSVFEGFGIPILEALYSGIPVITSTGSCFSETGGNAALYCDPYDYRQLGQLMAIVLGDSGMSKNMVNKGFEHVRLFDEQLVAANLMKVYTALCE